MSASIAIPVASGRARDVERPRATPAVRSLYQLHVREAGQGRQASAARLLPLLPLLTALAACAGERPAVRAYLEEQGFTAIELHAAAPWPDRPCDLSELYAVGFTATLRGRRHAGTVCATDAQATQARAIARPDGPAPDWDLFRGQR